MTSHAKNIRTTTSVLTASWSLVLPLDTGRSIVTVKNIGANPVDINTNVNKDGSVATPDTTDTYPLAVNEVVSFDRGVAPTILWAKSALGSTIVLLVG